MPINLEDAIKIHSNWKNRLLQATSSGTEVLDPVRIGQDCNCLLGKWLHTEGKIQYGQMPSFNDCVKKHAEFHMQASKVAKNINDGQYELARKMLDRDTPYGEISLKVIMAIRKLQQEAKL